MPRRFHTLIPLDPAYDPASKAWSYLQAWEKESWRWYATKVNSSGYECPYDNYKRPIDLFCSCQTFIGTNSPDGWVHVAPGWYDWQHDPYRVKYGYEDRVKRLDPMAPYM